MIYQKQKKIKKFLNQVVSFLMLMGLVLPAGFIYAYESESYEIEDFVVDSGGGKAKFGDGYNHSSFGQIRDDIAQSGRFDLLSGFLPYDDEPPEFIGVNPETFLEPINSLSGQQFNIHVRDSQTSNPSDFRLQSGLNLQHVYYKASQTGKKGTWGYSDSGGNWIGLDDGVNPDSWARVENVTGLLADCGGLLSCVTDTDGIIDEVSYSRDPQLETIVVKINFTNDPFTPEEEDVKEGEDPPVPVEPTVVFKVVDTAGNVSFSQSIAGDPWLKTEEGSIHSNRKVLFFNTPDEESNVGYVASAGDSLIGVYSQKNWQVENYPAYLEALEWPPLRYDQLISQASTSIEGVEEGALGSGILMDNHLGYFEEYEFLAGQIYYREGDLLSDSRLFRGVAGGRAATIVVDGNLHISQDIVLDGGGYLAFLVRGDIIIQPTVSEIQGTFIADYSVDGSQGGVISTGEDTLVPNQLIVTGQLIARAGFRFQRQYSGGASGDEPAEYIIYDPQVLINTPPGLQFLPSVGAWEEVVP